ncbi:maleylpyruvate isomerase family mycothiol-dependent enzyme [Streptomyces ureilyticus]|uniref:Maleylpyruvate isomerase family mycothiol-dependent enzyme n=1 Tax=Streptomyces ureilyticus TaxID=1775131 RepID=A0ABX0DZ82_9ACTN|nr:maleylpyruvate isomerase family mycothiol-dependent enzyme [Streptomyces ureilyticus]NGO46672.1 maleylpyruvate isomerase family mycothiol-dependent enzyme [Streptomyces ureilyticus]
MTSTVRHDLTVTLPWMRDGTALLLGATDRLGDPDLRAPSTLPDWTRAHVIGHVARNAEALVRLATWARTGVPTPMYGSREQRTAEIDASATLPPDVLREQLKSTAAELDDALAALDPTAWGTEVRSALGRTIPAAEIPWMRVREVWLHAIDLAAGVTFTDLPAPLTDALLDDVTAALSTRPGCPPVHLNPTDRDRTWRFGPTTAEATAVAPVVAKAEAPTVAQAGAPTVAKAEAPTIVEAPATELLAWTTGRAQRAEPVTLPRWL